MENRPVNNELEQRRNFSFAMWCNSAENRRILNASAAAMVMFMVAAFSLPFSLIPLMRPQHVSYTVAPTQAHQLRLGRPPSFSRVTFTDNKTSVIQHADRVEILQNYGNCTHNIWNINTTKQIEQVFDQCVLAYPCRIQGLNVTEVTVNGTVEYLVNEQGLLVVTNERLELQRMKLCNTEMTPDDALSLYHLLAGFNSRYFRYHVI